MNCCCFPIPRPETQNSGLREPGIGNAIRTLFSLNRHTSSVKADREVTGDLYAKLPHVPIEAEVEKILEEVTGDRGAGRRRRPLLLFQSAR